MKHSVLLLTAVLCSLFITSCGLDDNPIIGVNEVEKSDLTTPLFLAFDNTLDKSTKKIWAFNETEAVKGTVTVEDNTTLRVKTEWFFDSWSYASRKLTLKNKDGQKTYDLNQVSVLSYNAISFGTTYVCIPSSNKSLDGVRYEDDWYNHGLTRQAFWDALRKSYEEGINVDIKLNN